MLITVSCKYCEKRIQQPCDSTVGETSPGNSGNCVLNLPFARPSPTKSGHLLDKNSQETSISVYRVDLNWLRSISNFCTGVAGTPFKGEGRFLLSCLKMTRNLWSILILTKNLALLSIITIIYSFRIRGARDQR